MGGSWDRARQIAHAVAGQAPKPEIAANSAASRGDRARAAPVFAENEATDRCSADHRHADRPLAEMGEKKALDHPAILSASVLLQAPDVAHVSVEIRQLLSDDGVAIPILQQHAGGSEYLQKMTQRCLQLMTGPADWKGAGARWQVLGEKAQDGALADRFQVVPLPFRPKAEVCNAAHIDPPDARRISPKLQVLPVLQNVGPKNTGLQPSAGPWLNDALSLHADLLPS